MQRPTSVTVFGILNLVFAAFGLCGLAWTIMTLYGPLAGEMADLAKDNPALKQMQDDPVFSMYTKVGSVLGAVFTLVLIVGGVGLLLMRPWGRVASIVYGVYGIVSSVVGGVFTYLFILGPMMQKAQDLKGPEQAGLIGGAIGGVFGTCLGLIYPILLLVFMFRSNVVAAFSAASATSADRPPDGPFETGNPYQSQ